MAEPEQFLPTSVIWQPFKPRNLKVKVMTNSSNNTVAIFGATGAQGAPVVREALKAGYDIRAIARDINKVKTLHPKAHAVAADLSDEAALIKALDNVDAAFLHFPRPEGPDDSQNWASAFFSAAHKVKLPFLVFVTGGPTGTRFPSSVIVDATTEGMKAILNSEIPSVVFQSAVYLENLQPEVFLPKLRSEGILDYPPVPRDLKVQWTSHIDQAKLVVAALGRTDLAGQSFEIGTPGALTGDELAKLIGNWIERDVTFDPMSPEDFGQRIGEAFNSPGAAFALSDLYGSIAKLNGSEMTVDTNSIEDILKVRLTSVEDHIQNWPKP